MITTFLIGHPWLSPAALAVLVALGPLAGRAVAARPSAARALTGLALVPVVVLTMLPTDRYAAQRCEVAFSVPTIGRVELAANVVLFVAPALFAAVATRRTTAVLLGGVALSAVVEAVQALVPALGRSCSTNDVLSNTVGVAIGVLLGSCVLRSTRATYTAERPVGERVGVVPE